MAAAGRLRNKRLHNHSANKERLMREQSEKELQQLEVWFAEYDKDHNNKFDREELRQLFKVIEPKYELTDAAEKFMIEKIDTTPNTDNYGKYLNEVIQYTGKAGNNLTGCTRGTAAPYKGVTLQNTAATTHSSGASVFGSYLATAIATTVITGAQPATETQYNSLTVPLVSNATSTDTGGGFQCTIGPINDKA